ncbi:hypothetical protein [Vibrio rarus]|uniref:hypothetical protein n=1 Tax=Vibrio rarus TaxID=413403 RepID=UPI0021C258BE|nr:hypothetical protein [Vibrio rarus]
MTRLLAIVILITLAFLFIRYNTNEKLQKWVVIVLCSAFVIYSISLMVSELLR